jgi:hypothetical protein
MQQVTITLRFNTPFKLEGTDEQIARWAFLNIQANAKEPLEYFIESWTVENFEEKK